MPNYLVVVAAETVEIDEVGIVTFKDADGDEVANVGASAFVSLHPEVEIEVAE